MTTNNDNFIYHGTINIAGRPIEATWTTGFNTIWAFGKQFEGYREVIEYINNTK